jgi:hypothetical protein
LIPFTNLPATLDPADVAKFNFGDPDAAHDQLLKEGMCICRIRPLEEFIKDTKTILIGDKGTGKTGVFELLRDGKLRFVVSSNYRQRLIPINQRLDYRALRDRVVRNIVSRVEDESLKYQVVWELLILYSILRWVKDAGDMPAPLEKACTEFEQSFPIEQSKPGFLEIFLGAKKKVGVKFETSPTSGLPAADCYFEISGDESAASMSDVTPNLLRLGQLKQLINNHLAKKKSRIYVLIDRIDEFLIKEEYDIQRMTLQGLVACERSYRQYHNLRIKLFLRRDLFEQIDLREFGADKVLHDALNLTWTAEEIRDFLSKRILYNYLTVWGMTNLQLILNEENLYVDRSSNQPRVDEHSSRWRIITRSFWRVWLKVRRFVNRELLRKRFNPWEGRHTNFNDAISREILQSFFPNEVWREDPLASKKSIGVVEFLSTHFDLAWGSTTPRILLMFAQQCVDCAVNFSSKNPDIAGTKRFPVLTRDVVSIAYGEFRKRLWEMMAAEGKQWHAEIEAFRLNFAELGGASFEQVQEAFPAKPDSELRGFLAVLQHLGIVSCVNREFALAQRYYKLPILFRMPAASPQ